MISKAKIQELRDKLKAEYDQHIANANATKGAMSAFDLLLSMPDEETKCCSEDKCSTE